MPISDVAEGQRCSPVIKLSRNTNKYKATAHARNQPISQQTKHFEEKKKMMFHFAENERVLLMGECLSTSQGHHNKSQSQCQPLMFPTRRLFVVAGCLGKSGGFSRIQGLYPLVVLPDK